MKISLEWRFHPRDLAEAFCELPDDEQAAFFVEVAKIVEWWDDSCVGAGGSVLQPRLIGRRLKGEMGAREFLNTVVDAADEVSPGDLMTALRPEESP